MTFPVGSVTVVSRGKPLRPELATAIRRAAAKAKKASAERDELVLQALDEGVSTRDLGEVLGMSHVGVQKIRQRRRGG